MNQLHSSLWIKIGVLCLSLHFPWTVVAVEIFSRDQEHRGVVKLAETQGTNTRYCQYCRGEYQIFPEKRLGNALYFQNKLLVTFPNQQILDLFEIPDAQALVYLYADSQQKLAIGLYDFSEKKEAKIKSVDGEFYEVWVFALGIRTIFRIYQNRLERVASHLRSATGVTPAHSHVAFYHIAKSEIVEQDGKKLRVYEFKIHILKRSEAQPRGLSLKVQDTRSILKLSWLSEDTLRYELADGSQHDINLANLLPDYF